LYRAIRAASASAAVARGAVRSQSGGPPASPVGLWAPLPRGPRQPPSRSRRDFSDGHARLLVRADLFNF